MMTAIQILERLAGLKDTEVHIERGDYSTRTKWAVRVVHNGFGGEVLDRVSVEAKNTNFEAAVVEVWEKFERVALTGLGKAVLQPAIEHHGQDPGLED